MRKEIIGNWKMNGLRSAERTFRELVRGYDAAYALIDIARLSSFPRLTLCPPSTLLGEFSRIAKSAGSQIILGGQYCHQSTRGSYTGEVSAAMLKDSGAQFTLVGHAERRAMGESDEIVALQLRAALCAGLTPVLCVGERQAERAAGRTHARLGEQLGTALAGALANETEITNDVLILLAYEPVWAIGSGEMPSTREIAETCAVIASDAKNAISHLGAKHLGAKHHKRKISTPVLYGGSVTSLNAGEILQHTDGLLVGKASLDSTELLAIVAAANDVVQ